MRAASFHRRGVKAIHPTASLPLRALVLASLALLGSCAAPTPPAPAPAPLPKPRPAPPPLPRATADWRDAPQTPGSWTWRSEGGLSIASFGPLGAAPLASITCDRAAGQVLIARQGRGDGAVPLQIATTSTTRPLASEPLRSKPGWLVAALRARDPLLDAIAFSRGRFAFEAAGEATLYLPSWPEIGRAIEDCR